MLWLQLTKFIGRNDFEAKGDLLYKRITIERLQELMTTTWATSGHQIKEQAVDMIPATKHPPKPLRKDRLAA